MYVRYLILLPLFLIGLVVGIGNNSRFGAPSTASGTVARTAALQASAPTIALVPSVGPPFNRTIDVQVTIANTVNLAAFEFDLYFDREIVQLVSVTLNPLLGQTANCNAAATRCAIGLGPLVQGEITSLGAYSYGTGAGASGNGVLAVLHFQPLDTTGGTTQLRLSNALVTAVDATSSIPIVQDATLTVPTQLFLPVVRK